MPTKRKPLPSLGRRLRWARKAVGMSQAKLAEAVGKWERSISYIEEDRVRDPTNDYTVEKITRIAEALGIHKEFLLLEHDDGKHPEIVRLIRRFEVVESDNRSAKRRTDSLNALCLNVLMVKPCRK